MIIHFQLSENPALQWRVSLLAEVSLSFLSFLPRRERPLLAGNSVSDLGIEQTFKWIIMFAHISLTSHQIQH